MAQSLLRAKHLSNLSGSARSFFISGSRCSATEGNSCSCSEDENCGPQRQQARNRGLHAQNPSSVVSNPVGRAGILIPRDAVKVADSGNSKSVDQTTSIKQVATAPTPSVRSDAVRYAKNVDVIHKDVNSSPPATEQFAKAGIAAVNLFSEIVSNKILLSDGMGGLNLPINTMVRLTVGVSSVKSSNVTQVNRDNFISVYPNPSTETASASEQASNHQRSKGYYDKSSSGRGLDHVPYNRSGKSATAHSVQTPETHDRRAFQHKPKAQPNHFIPGLDSNVQISDAEVNRFGSKGFSRPVPAAREMKIPTAVTPFNSQFLHNGNVVQNVSHILQQLKWGPSAEAALRNLNCSMDAYQANQVLKQLQDHSVALGFFNWLKRQAGFKHDGHTFTTMVGILGRARQFGTVNKLLSQMVNEGCQPNVVTYNRLIHSFGRANYLKDAMNVFSQMQAAGCEPDRVTYCTLIDIHAKSGFLDVALGLYDRMQKAGLTPDTFTYSVMINCLGKAGNLAAAHRLFCEMVDHGCVPNLVTYNIMIALQAKARNYETALKLYHDMQGAGFQPDKVTYSIVMEVLGHCGYLEEAEALFGEMKRKNWVPDELVYGLLVDLWGKAGNVQKAWDWYQAMFHAGLRPNVPTCNSLLSAFLRVHRLSDAYNLLHSMVGLGLNPSLQTYTLLLSCCIEAQSPYDMEFCCELMAVTRHPAHTFLLSMPSAGPDGQNVREHMNSFLNLMHSEDRESKRGIVDAVVDFLHKTGLKEEAGSVWEVAAQKNVYPDVVKEKGSSYWLINLHVMSDGTAVTALSRTLASFRQQMLISGVCPNRIDIVTGWGRRSRVAGTSMVRHAVQELLRMFSFPFFTENGNSGCFVGCGDSLNKWLLESYVERMHLL